MSTPPLIKNNPYGYNPKTIDELKAYLTRHVAKVCFASTEDLYAATVLDNLQNKLAQLEQEISRLHNHNSKLEYERELDSRRLIFCLTHHVIMEDSQIFNDLDCEPILNHDYRAALDKLMF